MCVSCLAFLLSMDLSCTPELDLHFSDMVEKYHTFDDAKTKASDMHHEDPQCVQGSDC